MLRKLLLVALILTTSTTRSWSDEAADKAKAAQAAKTDEAKPAEAKPNEVKKEEPKPPPRKKAVPTTSAVFGNLPENSALDIPEPPADAEALKNQKPFAVAAANISPQAIILTNLLGGEVAVRGGLQNFGIESVSDELNNREWNIVVRDPVKPTKITKKTEEAKEPKLPPGTPIANVTFKDGKFWFTWSVDVSKQPNLGYLRNCALQLSAGQEKNRKIAFRKPLLFEPLEVDLDGDASVTWDVPYLPNLNIVKIDIMVPRDSFPQSKFVGKNFLVPTQNSASLHFGGFRRAAAHLMQIKFDTELKKGLLTIKSAPYFQIGDEAKPIRLSAATLKRAELAATAEAKRAKSYQDDLEAQKTNLSNLAVPRAQGGVDYGRMKQEQLGQLGQKMKENAQRLKVAQANIELFPKIKDTLAEIEGKTTVNFRIMIETPDGAYYTLADTKPAVKNKK